MFTIERPKEIHLNSWKEIINESASSNSFQFKEVNFSLFLSSPDGLFSAVFTFDVYI